MVSKPRTTRGIPRAAKQNRTATCWPASRGSSGQDAGSGRVYRRLRQRPSLDLRQADDPSLRRAASSPPWSGCSPPCAAPSSTSDCRGKGGCLATPRATTPPCPQLHPPHEAGGPHQRLPDHPHHHLPPPPLLPAGNPFSQGVPAAAQGPFHLKPGTPGRSSNRSSSWGSSERNVFISGSSSSGPLRDLGSSPWP